MEIIIAVIIAVASITAIIILSTSKQDNNRELHVDTFEQLRKDKEDLERDKLQYEMVKTMKWGEVNSVMICPHCQTKGKIRTKSVTLKQGISGAKATGAIFTAGLSLVVTGLSKKNDLTQAYCEMCKSTWHF